jgi:hypothetical protein
MIIQAGLYNAAVYREDWVEVMMVCNIVHLYIIILGVPCELKENAVCGDHVCPIVSCDVISAPKLFGIFL